MKKAKRFFALVCFGCICVGIGKLLQLDSVRDKLFEALGEDTYLALDSTIRLLADLVMWPVHFVKALLP